MHIVRLRLESETLLPTHQCWVSCGAHKRILFAAQYQLVGRHHKEYCVMIKLAHDY